MLTLLTRENFATVLFIGGVSQAPPGSNAGSCGAQISPAEFYSPMPTYAVTTAKTNVHDAVDNVPVRRA